MTQHKIKENKNGDLFLSTSSSEHLSADDDNVMSISDTIQSAASGASGRLPVDPGQRDFAPRAAGVSQRLRRSTVFEDGHHFQDTQASAACAS